MYSRSSGILLPISSLPSKYGIGTFCEAYNFVDFLKSAGQKYWQILPMGPVSYGDSPYSPFSVYAGNPYYIDLEKLIQGEFITEEDCAILSSDDEYVDYEKQFYKRFLILFKAYESSKNKYGGEINCFKNENQWVFDYALYMAIKYKYNQKPWNSWDDNLKNRADESLNIMKVQLSNEIDFWIFLQYLFYKQYFELKEYANGVGISIIGDVPIYAAEDSADVWCCKELFMFDKDGIPALVAGVPPDDFSDDGQLWGNPVYNWKYHKETSFKWWVDRIEWSFKLYDVVRIDHFRGFDEFWAIPYGSENAINGKWLPACGEKLIFYARKKLGSLNIIAEDLGIITDSVRELIKLTGFPGMNVLQFAFDGNPKNPYLPNNYEENSVAYTGTHDNDTLKGWFEKLSLEKQQYVLKTLDIHLDICEEYTNEILDEIINSVLMSKSNITIIPLQDYLHLGSEARINTPSTIAGNWTWRVKREQLNNSLAQKIKDMSIASKRNI